MDTYRTFVAIELPQALRAKLIEHIGQFQRQFPEVRASWSREHSLHLTLKFLGDIPVGDIPKLSDAIALAVSGIQPFELTVAGGGVFPPRGRPNVLWIGVGSTGILPADRGRLAGASLCDTNTRQPAAQLPRTPLTFLYQRIEDECAKVGFPREQRALHPHVTIARLRKHGDERRLAETHQNLGFLPETLLVSEVVVFRSELLREGSKHTVISRHKLHLTGNTDA